MRVIVNGESRDLGTSCSVAQLLTDLRLTAGRVAVEINEDVIRFLTIRVDELEKGPSAMMRRGEKERERRSERGDRDDRPSFRAREEEVE